MTLLSAPPSESKSTNTPSQVTDILQALERDGVVVLPDFVEPQSLQSMQRAFDRMLQGMRWSEFEGYQRTERYRHMVEDVLLLDQGFVDVALNETVLDVLDDYIGTGFQLAEAKGWKSLPTSIDFHGWHGDAWYDQSKIQDHIPREVKLAVYLTDVRSGAFHYLVGSHRQAHPKGYGNDDVQNMPGHVLACEGAAGTAILFDTSGIHRQSMPIVEERRAIFLNYHDRSVPVQAADVRANRYHPLLLNAAFLGDLSERDRRVLGFGDKQNYLPSWSRPARHPWLQAAFGRSWAAAMHVDAFAERVRARLARGSHR